MPGIPESGNFQGIFLGIPGFSRGFPGNPWSFPGIPEISREFRESPGDFLGISRGCPGNGRESRRSQRTSPWDATENLATPLSAPPHRWGLRTLATQSRCHGCLEAQPDFRCDSTRDPTRLETRLESKLEPTRCSIRPGCSGLYSTASRVDGRLDTVLDSTQVSRRVDT